MTKSEKAHINAIIKYDRKEFVYDEWAYKRLQSAYRDWLKNLLKHGHPDPTCKGK
jgi:hypothetical protein